MANFGSDTISIINAWSGVITNTISFAAGLDEPSLFADNDERGFVYLACHGSNNVYYLKDGQSWNVTLPEVPAAYGVAFDPVTAQLYVANRGDHHTVTRVDADRNVILSPPIAVGREPFVVGVNSQTGHIFVVLGDRVQVYDRRDDALIATIPVGAGAEEGIVVDETRGRIYVTSGAADTVTVIQDAPVPQPAFIAAGVH